jgi:hypothetical protein
MRDPLRQRFGRRWCVAWAFTLACGFALHGGELHGEESAAGPAARSRFDVGLGVGAIQGNAGTGLSIATDVRFKPTRSLALELEIGHWQGPVSGLEKHATEVSGNLLWVSGDRVAPFLGVGLGHRWASEQIDLGSSGSFAYGSETSSVHFLIGVDVRLSDRLTAFGSARFNPHIVGDDDGWEVIKRYNAGIRLRF